MTLVAEADSEYRLEGFQVFEVGKDPDLEEPFATQGSENFNGALLQATSLAMHKQNLILFLPWLFSH